MSSQARQTYLLFVVHIFIHVLLIDQFLDLFVVDSITTTYMCMWTLTQQLSVAPKFFFVLLTPSMITLCCFLLLRIDNWELMDFCTADLLYSLILLYIAATSQQNTPGMRNSGRSIFPYCQLLTPGSPVILPILHVHDTTCLYLLLLYSQESFTSKDEG